MTGQDKENALIGMGAVWMDKTILEKFLNKDVKLSFVDNGSDIYCHGILTDITDEFVCVSYNDISRLIALSRIISCREVAQQ